MQAEAFWDVDGRGDFGGHMESATMVYYTELAQGPYDLKDGEYGVEQAITELKQS